MYCAHEAWYRESIGLKLCSVPAIFMSSTFSDKNNPCFRRKKDIPSSVLVPIPVQIERFQSVLLTRGLQVGDHTKFNQEERQDLQRLTQIWATCVVEDASKYLDILTLEF